MFETLKDAAAALSWVVASIGGTIAAFKAVAELRRANRERADALLERQRSFRWRQAEMARTVLDALWADPLARAAMKLLDWSGLTYTHDGGKTAPITREGMLVALRTKNTAFTHDEQFVRDAFDQLFDGFERIEHYLSIDLLVWDDVRARLDYHVRHLARDRVVFNSFLEAYGYTLAARLLARFPAWTMASTLTQAGDDS
jgi:hypothetical protein